MVSKGLVSYSQRLKKLLTMGPLTTRSFGEFIYDLCLGASIGLRLT